MELLYVLTAGLILLIALAFGEATYPTESKSIDQLPPERQELSPQICRFPEPD